jgi:hypothetical protein
MSTTWKITPACIMDAIRQDGEVLQIPRELGCPKCGGGAGIKLYEDSGTIKVSMTLMAVGGGSEPLPPSANAGQADEAGSASENMTAKECELKVLEARLLNSKEEHAKTVAYCKEQEAEHHRLLVSGNSGERLEEVEESLSLSLHRQAVLAKRVATVEGLTAAARSEVEREQAHASRKRVSTGLATAEVRKTLIIREIESLIAAKLTALVECERSIRLFQAEQQRGMLVRS